MENWRARKKCKEGRKSKKTWIWLSIITLYAIYWVFYMPPVLFSSLYFAWFFEPYVGGYKNVTEQYSSILHSIHNMSLAFFFPICYICFAIVLFIKKRMYGASAPNQVSNVDLVIILQIFLISVINFTAASLYDYMQYAEVNEAIIITATFSWFHVHGFPPIIYLLLNKTIRNDSKKLFYKIFKKDKVTHIHGVTVLAKNTKNRIGATNNSRMLTNTNQSRTITKQTNNLPNTISGN
uniref:Serpentine receptor class gamma n=1 Tax=Meloidogyne incognita TaxID=6306 RepID=A0A914LV07_MELIC